MTHHTTSAKRSRPRFRYIIEVINELKKVVWLSRREVTYLTGMVLIVTIAFAIVLGTLDYTFSELIDALFMGE